MFDNLREHLSCVLLDLVQLPLHIGTEVLHGLVNLDLLRDARSLVQVLPSLNVDYGQSRLQ